MSCSRISGELISKNVSKLVIINLTRRMYIYLRCQNALSLSMSVNTFESELNNEHHHRYHRDNNNYENKRSQAFPLSYYYSQSSVLFQICQSCFWCASSFSRLRTFSKCPACQNEDTIDTLSIN